MHTSKSKLIRSACHPSYGPHQAPAIATTGDIPVCSETTTKRDRQRCRPFVVRSADAAGAYADRRDQAVTGRVALVLGLTTPEAVLVVLTGVALTRVVDTARAAHRSRHRFTPVACLRTLGRRR